MNYETKIPEYKNIIVMQQMFFMIAFVENCLGVNAKIFIERKMCSFNNLTSKCKYNTVQFDKNFIRK